MNGIDRRGFLRSLGLRAVDAMATAAATASSPSEVSESTGTPSALSSRPAARHPERCLTPAEVHVIAAEERLHLSAAQLAGLARTSIRLTEATTAPETETAGAWLTVPAESEPDAAIVLHLDRTADALAETDLAGSGRLTVTLTGASAEIRCDDDRSQALPAGHPFRLGAHLQLPRVWSDPVQLLDLDPHDQAAYVRVRDRVAVAQGLEAEQGAGAGLALHRLLGYPDDASGTLPSACAELAGAGEWLLFAQLSLGRSTRIFVWTARDDQGLRAVALQR